MWRALLVVIVLSLPIAARADTPTWIDAGIDRLGTLVFETLAKRMDYDGMIDLAGKLVTQPAFFVGKPMLADTVVELEVLVWTHQWRTARPSPVGPEAYRERAKVMWDAGQIDSPSSAKALELALSDFSFVSDLRHAYEVAVLIEKKYPHSPTARWSIRTRVGLHARHGEVALAAKLAKDFVLSATWRDRRKAFYVASDAMPLWLGLGDIDTAMRMLDWMDREQQRDGIDNGAMYMMDAVRLVDDHRLGS